MRSQVIMLVMSGRCGRLNRGLGRSRLVVGCLGRWWRHSPVFVWCFFIIWLWRFCREPLETIHRKSQFKYSAIEWPEAYMKACLPFLFNSHSTSSSTALSTRRKSNDLVVAMVVYRRVLSLYTGRHGQYEEWQASSSMLESR